MESYLFNSKNFTPSEQPEKFGRIFTLDDGTLIRTCIDVGNQS